MSTMVADSIAAALFPGSRRAVLGLLYGDTARAFYLREIIDLTGLGPGQVQRELARLSKAGILRRSEMGRHVYFQANSTCPIFDELRDLLAKTIGAVAQIRNAIVAVEDKLQMALIFGSFARGEEGSESDIDLLAVGDLSFGELVASLAEAELELGREIHSTLFSEREFCKRLGDDDPFLTRVLRHETIYLIGDEDELAKLRETPLDPGA